MQACRWLLTCSMCADCYDRLWQPTTCKSLLDTRILKWLPKMQQTLSSWQCLSCRHRGDVAKAGRGHAALVTGPWLEKCPCSNMLRRELTWMNAVSLGRIEDALKGELGTRKNWVKFRINTTGHLPKQCSFCGSQRIIGSFC